MADTIDDTTAARVDSGSEIYVPARSAAARHADDGAVIIDVTSRRVQRLNATASLVWKILGDDLTVGELADELADAFSVPREIVLADITPMLRSLHGAGFLDEVSTAPQPSADPVVDEGPVRLVSPPCGCLRSVEDLDWVAMTALQVDTTIFTVRSNDLAAHQVLVAALAAYVVEDPVAAGYYSIELSAEPTDEAPLRLWEGNSVLCQTTSTAALWERLHAEVSRHTDPEAGTVRLTLVAAVGPKGVALVPPHLVRTVHEHRVELAAAGVLLADGPADLDLTTGEVQVRAGLPVDEAAVDTFVSLLPGRGRVPGAPAGRHPVVAVSSAPGDGDALARLMAVGTTVLPHTVGAERTDPEILLGAIELLAAGPEVEPPADAADVATWLIDVLT
jgi:hypothetical protein